MKDRFRQLNSIKEEMAALKGEVIEWQRIAVEQQLNIDRLNCSLSAVIATLNSQPVFKRFDMKRLDAEMDRILKERLAEMERQLPPREPTHAHEHIEEPNADSRTNQA